MKVRFQSHAGSIEAFKGGKHFKCPCSGFNPTLVRLRRIDLPAAFDETLAFQSHAGSIEALESSAPAPGYTLFQSHAGPIEASHPHPMSREDIPFQSHAGSIEAAAPAWASPPSPWFQSHACSIEALFELRKLIGFVHVSIPRWFD